MKWFRSNIGVGSRLALFALAIQFLLSFGHSHGSSAQTTPALAQAKQQGLHGTARFAATHLDAFDRASHADAFRLVRVKTSADHEPAGQPADDCAICAVMALANTMVVATPPYLLGPQAAAFLNSTTGAEVTHLNFARVAFQPRAPPIA